MGNIFGKRKRTESGRDPWAPGGGHPIEMAPVETPRPRYHTEPTPGGTGHVQPPPQRDRRDALPNTPATRAERDKHRRRPRVTR